MALRLRRTACLISMLASSDQTSLLGRYWKSEGQDPAENLDSGWRAHDVEFAPGSFLFRAINILRDSDSFWVTRTIKTRCFW